MWKAEVIADSISHRGERITTIEATYPRIIHAEILRHRMFSSSVQSSRAVPVARVIEQVKEHPYIPRKFGANCSGMSSRDELSEIQEHGALRSWMTAAYAAVNGAQALLANGVHKQWANRLLEPFQYLTHLITATEWDNFFMQRISDHAQPEAYEIAIMIRAAMEASQPVARGPGEWHLPFVSDDERARFGKSAVSVSIGRSARVSYDRHHVDEDPARSIERAREMLRSGHMGPFEHAAQVASDSDWLASRERLVLLCDDAGHEVEAWTLEDYDAKAVLGGRLYKEVAELETRSMFANFNGWHAARRGIRREWCRGAESQET